MKGIKRTYKKLSPAERAEREHELELLEAERPEIEAWANAALDRLELIDNIVSALRAARMAKGISLSQVEEASGLGRSNISRLENHPDPNPKLETLLTYADAIGVELRIAVVDKATGKAIKPKGEAA
jgi:DNA-binding phage protein